MSTRTFSRLAAVAFFLVALAHAYRAFAGLPLEVGAMAVPTWVSWLAAAVAGSLSVVGWRSRS